MKRIYHIIRKALIAYAISFSLLGTIGLAVAIAAIATPILKVRQLRHQNPQESLYMASVREKLNERGNADNLLQEFVPLDSISPKLVSAVLAAEDDGFYSHPGFDLNAIANAMEHNRTQNNNKHGGSTITQQIAKNLFTGGERNYSRKGKELLYALLMEHFLGKDRILELYLNYAQWGKNIFGCEAAAKYYFKKRSSKLSLRESSRMAAVLAMPEKLNPHYDSKLLKIRLAVIANNLWLRHAVTDSTRDVIGGIESSPPSEESPGEESPENEGLAFPSD